MSALTNAPRGTQDLLPDQSGKWKYVEDTLLSTAARYGFHEIRTPTFEHTELFQRGVGDTTDVVQKEMYTFNDKGNRSVTLRPEGTAGVVRAALQNGLLAGALPLRCCYLIPCYRYEKPQAGRLREFHQFGAELFGPQSSEADAELIALCCALLRELGIGGIALHINSIGCPACRAQYHDALRAFLAARADALCETCKARLERNPMRVLDCKSPACAEAVRGAPVMLDYLCGDCREHFEGLRRRLDAAGIAYEIDPRIVRGLDYYTRTVFEFISDKIGAQGTVIGGGRYDGLVEELGGAPTPALGFAMGLERLMLLMQAQDCAFPPEAVCDVYIVARGDAARLRAFALCEKLRAEGFYAECDSMQRSIKSQMKYAGKIGAKYTAVIGDAELESGRCELRDMRGGATYAVALESFVPSVYNRLLDEACDGVLSVEITRTTKRREEEE